MGSRRRFFRTARNFIVFSFLAEPSRTFQNGAGELTTAPPRLASAPSHQPFNSSVYCNIIIRSPSRTRAGASLAFAGNSLVGCMRDDACGRASQAGSRIHRLLAVAQTSGRRCIFRKRPAHTCELRGLANARPGLTAGRLKLAFY